MKSARRAATADAAAGLRHGAFLDWVQYDGRRTDGTGTMSSVLAPITSSARPNIPGSPTRLCPTHGILPIGA